MNSDTDDDCNSSYIATNSSTKSCIKSISFWRELKLKQLVMPSVRKIVVVLLALVVCLAFIMARNTEEDEDECEEGDEPEEEESDIKTRRKGTIYRFFSPVDSYLQRQKIPNPPIRSPRRIRQPKTTTLPRCWFPDVVWRYYKVCGGTPGVVAHILVCWLLFAAYRRYSTQKNSHEDIYVLSESEDSILERTQMEDTATAESSASEVVSNAVERSPQNIALVHPRRPLLQQDAPLQKLPISPFRGSIRPLRPSLPSPSLLRATARPSCLFIGNRVGPRMNEMPDNQDGVLHLAPRSPKVEIRVKEDVVSNNETAASSESAYPASSSMGTTDSTSSSHRVRRRK